jgi:hypothetical protein
MSPIETATPTGRKFQPVLLIQKREVFKSEITGEATQRSSQITQRSSTVGWGLGRLM